MAIEQIGRIEGLHFVRILAARWAATDEQQRPTWGGQPVLFFAWEAGGELIDRQRQLVRLLPYLQLAYILYGVSTLDSIGPFVRGSCCQKNRERRTDENPLQAVRQPAGFGISLFRSHGHSGIFAAADASGTHRSFLS